MGTPKITTRPEQTIPRLELCAALLGVELSDLISGELDFWLNNTNFYMNSKVALRYIYNQTRCFYVYVSNREVLTSKSMVLWNIIKKKMCVFGCVNIASTISALILLNNSITTDIPLQFCYYTNCKCEKIYNFYSDTRSNTLQPINPWRDSPAFIQEATLDETLT